MEKTSKIYVAGHRGLVGSAILRALSASGYENIITRTHAELDLIDQCALRTFLANEQPDYVFLAAAKVGGILANSTYPADFIYQNLAIQTNVIHESWRNGVKRLLFLGSSCIYPRECPQPMKEDYLLSGPLEVTNRPYALAKIAGIEMCWAYNRQYGTNFLAVMPTNLYGPGDNYNLTSSHVIPALIRKMHESKISSSKEVIIWGTGMPRREFMYSEDMANACVFLMNLDDGSFQNLLARQDLNAPPLVNISYGTDISIADLSELIKDVVGFQGELKYDHSKPDGTPRKLLDGSVLNSLGWYPTTDLRNGISKAYQSFLLHHQCEA